MPSASPAPYGVMGQNYQDYVLRNGVVERVDPVSGARAVSARRERPQPPPAIAPAQLAPHMQPQQYASNPTEVLKAQFMNSDYTTFSALVNKVKRLPRSSSNRLDFDDLMKALRESRLVLDHGLFKTALRQLDESRQGHSVDYVKITSFLAQAWPQQQEIPGISHAMLTSGPSPDDPFQGVGARAGMQRPQPAEDTLFGTPIRNAPQPPHQMPNLHAGLPVGGSLGGGGGGGGMVQQYGNSPFGGGRAPLPGIGNNGARAPPAQINPVQQPYNPHGGGPSAQELAMKRDLARLEENRRQLEAQRSGQFSTGGSSGGGGGGGGGSISHGVGAGVGSPAMRHHRPQGGSANPFPGALAYQPAQPMQQHQQPMPPMQQYQQQPQQQYQQQQQQQQQQRQQPILSPHQQQRQQQQMRQAHMTQGQQGNLNSPFATSAPGGNLVRNSPPPPSSQLQQMQMGGGGGMGSPPQQRRRKPSEERAAAGVTSARRRGDGETPWATGDRPPLPGNRHSPHRRDDGGLSNGSTGLHGDAAVTDDTPYSAAYGAAHEGWDTKAHFKLGTGGLAEGSSFDEGLGLQLQPNFHYPHRHRGFDTGGSFNSNGSLRENVSRDESNGFMGGGHRHFSDVGRQSPTAQHDHMGPGMNPTEAGSQHPAYEGAYSANTAGRTTTSAFNADGTLHTNVSRDEQFQVGGQSLRHSGGSPELRAPAGVSVPRPAEGFLYGTR